MEKQWTDRHHQIYEMLRSGKRLKQVAQDLGIPYSTIRDQMKDYPGYRDVVRNGGTPGKPIKWLRKNYSELIGLRFGSWTVLSYLGRRTPDGSYVDPEDKLDCEVAQSKHKFMLCKCDCGFESPVAVNHLQQGTSTGCVRCRGKRGGKKPIDPSDFIGIKIGSWTVLSYLGYKTLNGKFSTTASAAERKNHMKYFMCKCGDCEKNYPVLAITLKNGDSTRCNQCRLEKMRSDNPNKLGHNNRKHHLSFRPS